MRNKNVGMLAIGFAVIMLFIVLSYDAALTEIVELSCTHGVACPMRTTIDAQRNVGIGIIIALGGFGAYFAFFASESEKIRRPPKKVIKGLAPEEKKIVSLLRASEGSMFQGDLIKQTGFSKVKMSRVLDRLETKKVVERKRRGMTNIVVLR